eukprot:6565257-Pyramimonas_sp.AAC.1
MNLAISSSSAPSAQGTGRSAFVGEPGGPPDGLLFLFDIADRVNRDGKELSLRLRREGVARCGGHYQHDGVVVVGRGNLREILAQGDDGVVHL